MDNFASNALGGFLIFAVIVILLFLVFREIICWYWKINQSITLLTEIRDLLAAKEVAQDRASTPAPMSVLSNRPVSIPSQGDPALSDEQQMETYGITFDGERYTYGEYKYGKLSDAVNYAKRQNKQSA